MENSNHQILLVNGKKLTLSGVKKVEASTQSQLCVHLAESSLSFFGSNISVTKLDMASGTVEAEGEFVQIKYSAMKQKGILKRILK